MRDHCDDFETQIEQPWANFVEWAIPRTHHLILFVLKFTNNVLPVGPVKENAPTIKYTIPRNDTGIPIFPVVDLNNVAASEMRDALTAYFSLLWSESKRSSRVEDTNLCFLPVHAQPEAVGSLPWNDISTNPGAFFDTDRFKLPVALKSPDSMSAPQIMILAEFLSSLALKDSAASFVFRITPSGMAPPSPHHSHHIDSPGVDNIPLPKTPCSIDNNPLPPDFPVPPDLDGNHLSPKDIPLPLGDMPLPPDSSIPSPPSKIADTAMVEEDTSKDSDKQRTKPKNTRAKKGKPKNSDTQTAVTTSSPRVTRSSKRTIDAVEAPPAKGATKKRKGDVPAEPASGKKRCVARSYALLSN